MCLVMELRPGVEKHSRECLKPSPHCLNAPGQINLLLTYSSSITI